MRRDLKYQLCKIEIWIFVSASKKKLLYENGIKKGYLNDGDNNTGNLSCCVSTVKLYLSNCSLMLRHNSIKLPLFVKKTVLIKN